MVDVDSELAIFCNQVRLPVITMSCSLLNWKEGFCGDPQTIEAHTRKEYCSLKSESGSSLPKKISIHYFEHRLSDVSLDPSPLQSLWLKNVVYRPQKEKPRHQHSQK